MARSLCPVIPATRSRCSRSTEAQKHIVCSSHGCVTFCRYSCFALSVQLFAWPRAGIRKSVTPKQISFHHAPFLGNEPPSGSQTSQLTMVNQFLTIRSVRAVFEPVERVDFGSSQSLDRATRYLGFDLAAQGLEGAFLAHLVVRLG